MSIAGTVKSFCKGHKISTMTLNELWELFKEKKPGYHKPEFEAAMLQIGAGPAKKMRELCKAYIKIHGYDSYDSFIHEVGHVSQDFWKTVYTGMVLFSPTQIVQESQPAAQVEEHQPTTEAHDDEEYYKKMIPLNWIDLSKSDRIDFVLKVQHQGFKDYLIKTYPDLGHYIKQVPPQKQNKLAMYITVFQFSSDTHSVEAKALLCNFIETLNSIGRAKLQYVECTNPNVIEIREVR